MPYVTFKSQPLSKSKLQKAVRLFRPSEIPGVLGHYWECIPDDKDYTDEEKLGFVIAFIPSAGNYTADYLHRLTIMGAGSGEPVNDRDYPGAKPHLYRRLQKLVPDVLSDCIKYMRPHKHVPENIINNDMWVGLVAIAGFIDWLYAGNNTLKAAMISISPSTPDIEKIRNGVRMVLASDEAITKALDEYKKTIRQNHMLIGGRT